MHMISDRFKGFSLYFSGHRTSCFSVIILFFLLISHSLPGFAQYKVEGTIDGYPNKNVSLLRYFGDNHSFADSLSTDDNGSFSIILEENAPSGLYSIALGAKPVFNFIFNQEDVIFKLDLSNNRLPEFIFSIENLIYYDYLVQTDIYLQKSGLIADMLQYYPDKDSYYTISRKQFNDLQTEFRDYTQRIINEHPTKLVSKIIQSDRPVMIPESLDWSAYPDFNRKHFLDEVDFSDTALINTNVLTGKSIDYMGFYAASNMGKEIQEQYFIQAVDTILHKAMVNGNVYDFLMQYLIEGFEMYGFENVISHIAENYEPANSCVNEDRKSELQKRVENLRKLAVGMQGPDVTYKGADGSILRLGDIDSKYVVILFWASWCPHCNSMMPQLKEVYSNSPKKFEVLAISLDSSADEFEQALADHKLSWINYCDLKGWDTQSAIDYSIYATPSMFILGPDRRIMARPTNAYELQKALDKLP